MYCLHRETLTYFERFVSHAEAVNSKRINPVILVVALCVVIFWLCAHVLEEHSVSIFILNVEVICSSDILILSNSMVDTDR